MENQIKISVIVPVYGVEKYIERCVTSLMEQTLDGVEFIFVDDCTPDASIEIAKKVIAKYPNRKKYVKWIRHEKNRGLPSARNSGLKVAEGKYIYHCDSDDRLEFEMLEQLYKKATSEHLDFVWCDFFEEKTNGIFPRLTSKYASKKDEMMKLYLTFGWNVVWNTLCERRLYIDNNIKSLESISFCEDFELMTRLLLCSSSWGKVEKPLYYYNKLNESSMVRNSMKSEKFKNTIENGITATMSIYNFIRTKDPIVFNEIKTELHWNILNAKKFICFNPFQRRRYLELLPECHSDIDSNPLCSNWHKKMQHFILNPVTAPIAWMMGLLFKFKQSISK